MTLPPCPARFAAKKAAILAHLAEPEDQYTDASPKGAVDEGVRPLLEAINSIDGFVTTSSCAGRVAIFLEGRRGGGGGSGGNETEAHESTDRLTTASAGGKGGGGSWLFVSHEPLLGALGQERSSYADTNWATLFGLGAGEEDVGPDHDDQRLVHFKFEPMILHVATASLAHAQLLLRCALAAGFRESGAVGMDPHSAKLEDPAGPMPVVAVRCMGLGLASVIGVGREDDSGGDAGGAAAQCIVSPHYLARLARVADQRFALNRERTERFRLALAAAMEKEQSMGSSGSSSSSSKPGWEDAAARRARLRTEGLERQAALQRQKLQEEAAAADQDPDGLHGIE